MKLITSIKKDHVYLVFQYINLMYFILFKVLIAYYFKMINKIKFNYNLTLISSIYYEFNIIKLINKLLSLHLKALKILDLIQLVRKYIFRE